MKASESDRSNQIQGNSIKISVWKNNNRRGNDRYLTKVQYHETLATTNVRYLTRYMPQNVSYSSK